MYHLVLGLVTVNDAAMLEELAIKGAGLAPEHLPIYVSLRDSITVLLDSYDYTRSPQFLSAINGRSAAVADMKRRFEGDPVKHAARRQAFISALESLPDSREAYQLVNPEKHEHLDRIIRLIARLDSANVG